MTVTTIKQAKLDAKLSDPAFAKRFRDSRSPGPVAAELGITREGVYQLVKRGRLDAIRIVTDSGRLMAYVIPDASVERYRATRYQRA